jgi:hypothetical protein
VHGQEVKRTGKETGKGKGMSKAKDKGKGKRKRDVIGKAKVSPSSDTLNERLAGLL